MKIIINTSSLKQGGGIQVGLSFIKECIHFPNNEYYVFLNPKISKDFKIADYPSNFHFYFIPHFPSSPLHYYSVIKLLKQLESQIEPDCVFTIFGPSYWTPKAPHLLGFAQGYYIFPESPFFERLSLIARFKISVKKKFHRFLFKRNATYFYIESETARIRLAKFLGVNEEFIYAVSNTYHSVFDSVLDNRTLLPPKQDNEFRFTIISSYYLHKNLEVIKLVLPQLKARSSKSFKFVLTIEENAFRKNFKGFEDDIINLGPVSIESCPYVYRECDALFFPSLIETFTASYPEAMRMEKPIVTSDLPFAREICDNAALYFDPLNPDSIVDKIVELTQDEKLYADLKQKGLERLRSFETAASRASKILDILENKVKSN